MDQLAREETIAVKRRRSVAALLPQAAESGCTLLTRNIKDFDHLQQLAPTAEVLFYRTV